MTVPTPSPHRLARAAVAASAATAAGVAAHAAGGEPVPVVGAAIGLAVVLGPAWLVARRERGWAGITAVQLAGQQAVHALLALAAGGATHRTVPEDLSLYGHLAAAALIAAWLRCGERRVWAAARRTRETVAAWLRWVLAPRRPRTSLGTAVLAAAAGAPGLGSALLRHVVVRRGPPLPA